MTVQVCGRDFDSMTVTVPLARDAQVASVVVAIVFGAIASVAVCLRLLAARISSRRLDASDYSILMAWLLTMGLMVTCILGRCNRFLFFPFFLAAFSFPCILFSVQLTRKMNFRGRDGRVWLALP